MHAPMPSIRIRVASKEEIIAAEQSLSASRHQTVSRHEAERPTACPDPTPGRMGGSCVGQARGGDAKLAEHSLNGALEVRIPQAQGGGTTAFCT
jgi:hypothetical protein